MTADERFDRIDQKLEALTQKLETLTRDVGALTQYVLEFRGETAVRFQNLETRMDVFAAAMAGLDSRPLAKALVEFGAVASHLQRAQSKQTDTTFDLVTRMAKLEEIVSRLNNPAA